MIILFPYLPLAQGIHVYSSVRVISSETQALPPIGNDVDFKNLQLKYKVYRHKKICVHILCKG